MRANLNICPVVGQFGAFSSTLPSHYGHTDKLPWEATSRDYSLINQAMRAAPLKGRPRRSWRMA